MTETGFQSTMKLRVKFTKRNNGTLFKIEQLFAFGEEEEWRALPECTIDERTPKKVCKFFKWFR